jgi:hypothetical protein
MSKGVRQRQRSVESGEAGRAGSPPQWHGFFSSFFAATLCDLPVFSFDFFLPIHKRFLFPSPNPAGDAYVDLDAPDLCDLYVDCCTQLRWSAPVGRPQRADLPRHTGDFPHRNGDARNPQARDLIWSIRGRVVRKPFTARIETTLANK